MTAAVKASLCAILAFAWGVAFVYLATHLHAEGPCVKPTAFPPTWFGDCK